MSKLYRINLNIDVKNVTPQLLINKTKQLEGGGFGEYTPAQFCGNIIFNSISMAHKTGNIATLRRTVSIKKQFDEAKDGLVTLSEDDYRYIKSSMDKADGWNNSIEIAESLMLVHGAVQNAEEVY